MRAVMIAATILILGQTDISAQEKPPRFPELVASRLNACGEDSNCKKMVTRSLETWSAQVALCRNIPTYGCSSALSVIEDTLRYVLDGIVEKTAQK